MAKDLAVVQEKINTVRKYINEPYIREQLNAALPSFLNADRFLRTFFSAMVRNPALLDCTKKSMASAMIECAQLGLEPILRKAALIPYGGEVQFQPMYGGLMDLGRRTGEVKITGHVVYEKDRFEMQYGLHEDLIHIPTEEEDPGEMIGAYTVWTFESGLQTFLFMPTREIYKARAVSQAWKKAQREPKNAKAQETPWVQWEGQQAIKTVIKRHSKLQPCSIEMERAIELDNRVEIGQSQADILGQLDFPAGTTTTSPPGTESEDEGPAQQLLDKFDLKVKEKFEMIQDAELSKQAYSSMKAYLKVCADTQEGATVNDVKASAIRKGFDSFWDYYGSWLKDQEVKPEGKKQEETDPIRREYNHLRKPGFKPWVQARKEYIRKMEQKYQDEIKAKWDDFYPGDPYPVDAPKEEATQNSVNSYCEGMSQKAETETENIIRLVEGARLTESGIAVSCPNTAQGVSVLRDKCDGIGMDACESRAGCPTWSEYVKDQANIKP